MAATPDSKRCGAPTHPRLTEAPQTLLASVGLISDTHGVVRRQALEALRGVDYIIHAGDVGDPQVLEALRRIAPVAAVRGNNDCGDWARRLPETEVVELGGKRLYVLHDLGQLDLEARAAGFHAVISGHSHRPRVEQRDGVLYVNPGSAGPRRFSLPVAVARLEIGATSLAAAIVELDVRSEQHD